VSLCAAWLANALLPEAWVVVRVALALILLSAAGLKAHQVLTGGGPVIGLFSSPAYTWAVITAELLLGLWLASGLKPGLAWVAVLVAFSGFAGVSLARLLHGEPTCACFGALEVAPVYALMLDVAAVAGLLAFRPAALAPLVAGWQRFAQTVGPTSHLQHATAPAADRFGWAAPALSLAVVLLTCVVTSLVRAPAELRIDGTITEGNVVVLRPDEWVGKRFPPDAASDSAGRLIERPLARVSLPS
jgi:hypothetical protein